LSALQRQIDVALAALCEDEIGAVSAHDLLALVAHAFGHHDRAAVALHGGHEGAGDSGVAGGALEHTHARAQVAPRFGALEHVQVDAVLEAAGRAVPLELQVDRRREPGGDAVQGDKRCAPDRLGDRSERATVRIPQNRHGSVIVPEISSDRPHTVPVASNAAGMCRISKRPSPRGVTATTSNRQCASAIRIHFR
jgi:hypothetical protein